MAKIEEYFFKVTMSDDKKEVKFEVKGLSPVEVISLCAGTINTALQQMAKQNNNKIIKPTLKDAMCVNQN